MLLASPYPWIDTAADVWALCLVALFIFARQHAWAELNDAASLRAAIINNTTKPPWVEVCVDFVKHGVAAVLEK